MADRFCQPHGLPVIVEVVYTGLGTGYQNHEVFQVNAENIPCYLLHQGSKQYFNNVAEARDSLDTHGLSARKGPWEIHERWPHSTDNEWSKVMWHKDGVEFRLPSAHEPLALVEHMVGPELYPGRRCAFRPVDLLLYPDGRVEFDLWRGASALPTDIICWEWSDLANVMPVDSARRFLQTDEVGALITQVHGGRDPQAKGDEYMGITIPNGLTSAGRTAYADVWQRLHEHDFDKEPYQPFVDIEAYWAGKDQPFVNADARLMDLLDSSNPTTPEGAAALEENLRAEGFVTVPALSTWLDRTEPGPREVGNNTPRDRENIPVGGF